MVYNLIGCVLQVIGPVFVYVSPPRFDGNLTTSRVTHGDEVFLSTTWSSDAYDVSQITNRMIAQYMVAVGE